jgi:hypothetical protein
MIKTQLLPFSNIIDTTSYYPTRPDIKIIWNHKLGKYQLVNNPSTNNKNNTFIPSDVFLCNRCLCVIHINHKNCCKCCHSEQYKVKYKYIFESWKHKPCFDKEIPMQYITIPIHKIENLGELGELGELMEIEELEKYF